MRPGFACGNEGGRGVGRGAGKERVQGDSGLLCGLTGADNRPVSDRLSAAAAAASLKLNTRFLFCLRERVAYPLHISCVRVRELERVRRADITSTIQRHLKSHQLKIMYLSK